MCDLPKIHQSDWRHVHQDNEARINGVQTEADTKEGARYNAQRVIHHNNCAGHKAVLLHKQWKQEMKFSSKVKQSIEAPAIAVHPMMKGIAVTVISSVKKWYVYRIRVLAVPPPQNK